VARFLPNLVWQIRHHFTTVKDLENVRREGKNVVLPPLAFIREQILANGPALLPVGLVGLVWFLWERRLPVRGPIFLSSSLRLSTPRTTTSFPFTP
jgi:hypothetical protein